ncbi:MAG: hypothetical protein ACI9FN_003057 [Saprospiraceae bacterium]|jgi:hypothetical protein
MIAYSSVCIKFIGVIANIFDIIRSLIIVLIIFESVYMLYLLF